MTGFFLIAAVIFIMVKFGEPPSHHRTQGKVAPGRVKAYPVYDDEED